MPLTVGTRLGHYNVTSLLGEGGMGQVWQATDTQLNREVALKILPDAFAADPDRLARFTREAQILASLNHPNIATIYGIEEAEPSTADGTSSGQEVKALVLELVEGPTLADRIKQGPIPLDEALPIAKQIAEALEAAHEAGVIHRDLKPANIKVREDGTVKVLDFGLAKALNPAPTADPSESPTLTAAATQMGVILGTAAYMSPEQARGKPVDRRADIWAFGAVLFEMLTGAVPFPGDDVTQTLARVVEREPDWELLSHQMPHTVTMLIKRCLRKNRTKRWHHAADVRIELEDAIDAGPDTPLAGDDGASMFAAVPAVKVQQLTANTTAIAVSGAAISPDGTYLAYADPTGLYLQVIETGETSPVVLSEDLRFSELAWLPDGTRLIGAGWATLGSTVALYSISILGGAPRKLRDGWRPAVSPDGKRVAFLAAAWPVQAIWTMGVDGQDPRQFVVGEEGEMFLQVCWSPDGRRLAYGHMTPDGTNAITSVDTDGRRRTTLVSDPDLFQDWRGILPCSWLPDGRLLFGKRDHPPNQFSSKLWAVSVDPQTGAVSAPREIVGWAGFNIRDIRTTRDGARLTVLVERNPPSVYVAPLSETGSPMGQPRRLTLNDRADYHPAWTHDGSAVLFQSQRGLSFDLFAQDLGDQVARPLVTSSRNKFGPELSPDGRWLLYQYWVDPLGRADVVRAPFAGGRVAGPSEEVLAGEFIQFHCRPTRGVMSEPDGGNLVFSEFDPTTGRGPELMRLAMGFADPRFSNWALSRDGRRVALGNFGGQIQILDLATKSVKTLTVADWTALEFLDWSADGESVFVGGMPAHGPFLNNEALLRVDMTGQVTVLLHEVNEWHLFPAVSPDGTHLAFATMVLDSNAWMVEDF